MGAFLRGLIPQVCSKFSDFCTKRFVSAMKLKAILYPLLTLLHQSLADFSHLEWNVLRVIFNGCHLQSLCWFSWLLNYTRRTRWWLNVVSILNIVPNFKGTGSSLWRSPILHVYPQYLNAWNRLGSWRKNLTVPTHKIPPPGTHRHAWCAWLWSIVCFGRLSTVFLCSLTFFRFLWLL